MENIPDEWNALVGGSVDLCKLNLFIGRTEAEVRAIQEAAFLNIGLSPEAAEAFAAEIVKRAAAGFKYDSEKAETLLRYLQSRTDELIDADRADTIKNLKAGDLIRVHLTDGRIIRGAVETIARDGNEVERFTLLRQTAAVPLTIYPKDITYISPLS
jgi:hypothetical protein